jgi:lipopolysaccharide biosynthesis protein
MAHHDVEDRADDHVLHAIDALVAHGADVHVVTTSADEAAHARLAQHATSVIVKDVNATTRDFGSWSLALATISDEELDRHRRVVLANDSSYFPVCDPGPMLAHLRASEADVWAATDSMSWDRYHVQSYFLALGPAARRRLVAEVDRRIARHAGLSKAGLVQRFEVGLTQFALDEGMSIEVFRPVRDVLGRLGREGLARHRPAHPAASTITNLTHHLWRVMIEREDLPFLKVELLRDNPLAIDITDWQGVVDARFADVGTIGRHLDRVRAAAAR